MEMEIAMGEILALQALESTSLAKADSIPFSTMSVLCPPFTITFGM